MKTKQETKESSVAVAFAELGRLEQERTNAAAAKQDLRDALRRQGRDLSTLRERFEATRPKVNARVRAQRAQRNRDRDQLTARLVAEAEAAHAERLSLMRAELETKRLRLAAVEVADTVPSTGRRVLEWTVPAAAIAMVAFLGFAIVGDESVAHAAKVEQSNPVVAPTSADVALEPVDVAAPMPVVVAEPMPEPSPEPIAVTPAPKPVKKSTSKKSTSKKSTSKKTTSETKSTPVVKKNSKPIELGDFGGDPLG